MTSSYSNPLKIWSLRESRCGSESIIDDALSAFGRIDIVVNNAGILRDQTFHNVTLENFHAVLNVHLMGVVHVTRAAWRIICLNGWGRVVLTSSGSGILATSASPITARQRWVSLDS